VSNQRDSARELGCDVDVALAQLSDREQEVVRLRFGIGDRMHDRGEVALRVGLTRSRVRQIEGRALRKLRTAAVDRLGDVPAAGAALRSGTTAAAKAARTPDSAVLDHNHQHHPDGWTQLSASSQRVWDEA